MTAVEDINSHGVIAYMHTAPRTIRAYQLPSKYFSEYTHIPVPSSLRVTV